MRLDRAVVCVHCLHVNRPPAGPGAAADHPLACGGCAAPLRSRPGLVKVNFGLLRRCLRLPELFEHLSHLKLEYRTRLGERPPHLTQVAGDLVQGSKTVISDSVLDRTHIAGQADVETGRRPPRPRSRPEADRDPVNGELDAVDGAMAEAGEPDRTPKSSDSPPGDPSSPQGPLRSAGEVPAPEDEKG